MDKPAVAEFAEVVADLLNRDGGIEDQGPWYILMTDPKDNAAAVYMDKEAGEWRVEVEPCEFYYCPESPEPDYDPGAAVGRIRAQLEAMTPEEKAGFFRALGLRPR